MDSTGQEVCVMQDAETVLEVLRERGRKGLPLTQLYRQMFNKDLYLLAYQGSGVFRSYPVLCDM